MDGSSVILQPPARAKSVRRAEQLVTRWAHIIDQDTDWREALSIDYWQHTVASKLMPGDAVEVHAADHRIVFEMRVLDVNVAAAPAFLEIAFRPIYPADLDLPQPAPQIPPRYTVRPAPGGGGAYRVYDTETARQVHENDKDRHSANELAAEMNRAVASSGAQIAAAFARHQAAADEPVPPRTAAAERTARWRARKTAEAATSASEPGDAV